MFRENEKRMKTGISRIAFLGILLLALCASLFSQSQGGPAGKMSQGYSKMEPNLPAAARKAAEMGQFVPAIVQFSNDTVSDEERVAIIRGARGNVKQHYSTLLSASVDLDPAALEALAENPRVLHISYDHEVKANLDTTVRAIGADQVWSGSAGLNYINGFGVTVAVIDSGITTSPDLLLSLLPTQVAFGQPTAFDKYGHGTHVAGIITGDGFASVIDGNYAAHYLGVAPGASVLNLRVLDEKGAGYTSNVLAALDWCVKNKAKYNIRVISLSLGHPVFESYKTDPLCQMVERCVAAGIVVVAAAGNYGKDDSGNPVYGGITSPGNDPAVITVGAVNTHDTAARSDDTVATYSSRGPTAIDGLIKPDLVAPGNKIVSTGNTLSTLYKSYPSNRLILSSGKASSSYLVLSGTSMATPVVSGTVALMLQANLR